MNRHRPHSSRYHRDQWGTRQQKQMSGPPAATITDPAQRQAYVMSHESGHVEYAETPGGHASLVQSDKDYSFTSQMFKQMGIQPALQLPAVQQANQRLLDASQEREQGADQRAWDIVGPQQ